MQQSQRKTHEDIEDVEKSFARDLLGAMDQSWFGGRGYRAKEKTRSKANNGAAMAGTAAVAIILWMFQTGAIGITAPTYFPLIVLAALVALGLTLGAGGGE